MQIKQRILLDYDIIIAGGGPAGSGLAWHLATNGLKVCVVEAEQFPRDKVCGDGVSPIALAELRQMGITQTDEFAQANEIKQVGLFLPNDQVFIPLSKPDHLPFHARIIPRLELDYWISNAAKKAGAVYVENTRVISYQTKPDYVLVECKEGQRVFYLKSKMLVGADGSSSTISRQLNGQKPDDEFQLLGLRAYYEGVNGPQDRVNIYFTQDSFPGIFWMFPKGPNGANIGMAMVSETLPLKPTQVRKMLMHHVEHNADIKAQIGSGKMIGKIQGWPITFYNRKSKLFDDRVVLVGEAAGLINPLSGDGIQYALLSARWLSEAILTCAASNNFSDAALGAYKTTVDKELGYDFALSNLLVQFPRNKSFGLLWMKILEVLIARAKKDQEYADLIAGIFEGTYPSHKALNAGFILKSLKEGGLVLSDSILQYLTKPEALVDRLVSSSTNWNTLFSELTQYSGDHLDWVKSTAGKTLTVAGEVLRHWVGKK